MSLGSDNVSELRADLHIHTCLSPCADLEMSPRAVVREAKRKGLALIGICDHNSAENVPAARRSGEREGVAVIGGMEVTSREEVHILGLFATDRDLFALQEIVYESLAGTNDERVYGEQVVANEDDEVVAFNTKLLIGATQLPLDRLVEKIHELNGLAIAAHADREAFGILGALGFLPDDLGLDALEIANPQRKHLLPAGLGPPFIVSSDAHSIGRIGERYTILAMAEPTLAEMRRCLRGEEGRYARI